MMSTRMDRRMRLSVPRLDLFGLNREATVLENLMYRSIKVTHDIHIGYL
jgi:hypothetical protein